MQSSHTNHQRKSNKIAPDTLMRMIKGNKMDERTHSEKFIITLHFPSSKLNQSHLNSCLGKLQKNVSTENPSNSDSTQYCKIWFGVTCSKLNGIISFLPTCLYSELNCGITTNQSEISDTQAWHSREW